MQNHLLAKSGNKENKKKKSIIRHLGIHLIWLVCLLIYNNLFFPHCQNQCLSFSISPSPRIHVCVALAPFSAVYVSG